MMDEEQPPEAVSGAGFAAPPTDADTFSAEVDTEEPIVLRQITATGSTASSDEADTTDGARGRVDEDAQQDTLDTPPQSPTAEVDSSTAINGIQIGIGLLAIGVLLLGASLWMIRRNRS